MSATYILVPNYTPTTDLVTEVWEADRRWAIGERNKASGTISFRHRTYGSLAVAAISVGVLPSEARKRKLPATGGSK